MTKQPGIQSAIRLIESLVRLVALVELVELVEPDRSGRSLHSGASHIASIENPRASALASQVL